ncbi:MAG: hypothetical protein V2I76_11670 [Roseobacter sp.]|nr:hypothetical protein [Roseobacter sp.]
MNKPEYLQRRLLVAGALLTLSFTVLKAQEIPDSARQTILEVGQRLEWSDNPELDEVGEDRFTSRTTLQYSGFRRASNDTLSFSLGGDLELTDGGADADDGLTNTNLGLGWDRNVRRSRTGLSFNYLESDLGSTTGTFFNEDTSSIDFGTVDRGSRETIDFRLDGAFGIDSPIGGSYDVWQRLIDYSDTEDEDLRDAERLTLSGDLFFVLNPRFTVGLDGLYRDFDEDGPDDLDTTDIRIDTFADVIFSQTLSGRFALGWEEVEESGTTNNTENGVVFDASLTQAMPRSDVTVGLGTDIVASGRRSEVRFGQSFDLPRNTLSYSLGLSRVEGEGTEPLLGLGWSQDLPRGALRALVEQTPATNSDNDNLINSRVVVGYTQELTPRSGFDLEFSFIDSSNRTIDDDDSQRLDIDLTYRHEVYRDWDLISGVSLVRLDEDGDDDRDANTIFIGLEKTFVWN